MPDETLMSQEQLEQKLASQRQWMQTCGGDLAGYLVHYKKYGLEHEQIREIFLADRRQYDDLEERLSERGRKIDRMIEADVSMFQDDVDSAKSMWRSVMLGQASPYCQLSDEDLDSELDELSGEADSKQYQVSILVNSSKPLSKRTQGFLLDSMYGTIESVQASIAQSSIHEVVPEKKKS